MCISVLWPPQVVLRAPRHSSAVTHSEYGIPILSHGDFHSCKAQRGTHQTWTVTCSLLLPAKLPCLWWLIALDTINRIVSNTQFLGSSFTAFQTSLLHSFHLRVRISSSLSQWEYRYSYQRAVFQSGSRSVSITQIIYDKKMQCLWRRKRELKACELLDRIASQCPWCWE